MTTKKFDTKLPCKMPLGYIEKETHIKTNDPKGEFVIISYGALETENRHAFELGGLAITNTNPDFILGLKYIPWNPIDRSTEHDKVVNFMRQNLSMSNQEFLDAFYNDGYLIPEARNDRYMKEMDQKRQDAKNKVQEEMRVEKEEKLGLTFEGEKLIQIDE
ncbi:MAG: hypothetical protein ACTSU7_01425 [Candidatus Heimdallarchaeaceae archaeon]